MPALISVSIEQYYCLHALNINRIAKINPTLERFLCLQYVVHHQRKPIFPSLTVYIKATATLCIITLLTDIAATTLTCMGLKTQNHNMKYKYYRYAVLVMLVSCKLIYLYSSIATLCTVYCTWSILYHFHVPFIHPFWFLFLLSFQWLLFWRHWYCIQFVLLLNSILVSTFFDTFLFLCFHWENIIVFFFSWLRFFLFHYNNI